MDGKHVLMVEGPDDEHVVKNICGTKGLGKIETIHAYGGKEPLLDGIAARLKESDITALGSFSTPMRIFKPDGKRLPIAWLNRAMPTSPPHPSRREPSFRRRGLHYCRESVSG